MPDNNLTRPGRFLATSQNLGSNEKAILDSLSIPILRNIFTILWRVKLRLQFTGWLQYIPTALFTLAFFLIASLLRLLGGIRAANIFGFVGIFLLVLLIFDLVTVKFRLRPREHLPKRNDDLEFLT